MQQLKDLTIISFPFHSPSRSSSSTSAFPCRLPEKMLWGTEEKEHPPFFKLKIKSWKKGLLFEGGEETGYCRHKASDEGLGKEMGEEDMVLCV